MIEPPIADWQSVVTGDAVAARVGCGGSDAQTTRIVFPGAFNPLHDGHRRMAVWAKRWLNESVEFEMSITNVDKPNLTAVELRQRLDQFSSSQPVWVTRAPTFLDKSALFPGVTFLVGADTISRIGDPTYYELDRGRRDAAIEDIRQRRCRFLVFGRVLQAEFHVLHRVKLPDALSEICQEVTEADFREDISSTEMRR